MGSALRGPETMGVTLPALRGSQAGRETDRHNTFQTSLRVSKMVKERFIPPGRSGEATSVLCLWSWGTSDGRVGLGASTTGSGKRSGVERAFGARAVGSTLLGTMQKGKKKLGDQPSMLTFHFYRLGHHKKRKISLLRSPSFHKHKNILIFHPLLERTYSPDNRLSFKVGVSTRNPYFPFYHRL